MAGVLVLGGASASGPTLLGEPANHSKGDIVLVQRALDRVGLVCVVEVRIKPTVSLAHIV